MRIAVVGAGYWGVNLIRVFHQLGVLDCVCDSYPARLQELAANYPGIRLESSLDNVFADPGIEAVVIATPAEAHYEIAKRAMEAGKDCFVEKPLALRCEDAEDLIAVAQRTKRILMVGHLLEFHPAITALQELIEQGDLGRLEYIYSNRLNLGKVRREENALWSFAPHDISVILLLLKQLPIQVTATGGTYLQPNIADVTVSTMLFARGVRAHLFVSWLHPYKEQRLVVIGEHRMAVFDDVRKSDKLQIYEKKIDLVNGQFVVDKRMPQTVSFSTDEPLVLECQHFLECIETRRPPKTDGADALRVLRVLEASQRSLTMNGEPVQLEPHRSLEQVRG
ncbi:MAG TPA: Gfo/Idh/MocA family oxidoreductase [Bryobacteraceae bacterium]|nr:Gfo/Idh/MocA family oxidoreductase [Bryobacteraceae bacterium]